MIVISAQGNGAGGVGDHIFGGNQRVESAEVDAMIVVANAEQLNAACNGRFHDGLGAVLAAKRIISVGMKVLNHRVGSFLTSVESDVNTEIVILFPAQIEF